jgi:hypothetical protein
MEEKRMLLHAPSPSLYARLGTIHSPSFKSESPLFDFLILTSHSPNQFFFNNNPPILINKGESMAEKPKTVSPKHYSQTPVKNPHPFMANKTCEKRI